MVKLTLKVKKIGFKNPSNKQAGFVARVVTNGVESFDDLCHDAGLNTTMNPVEIEAASKLMLQAAAKAIKNGKIVDLGVLGKIYPSVSGKWVEKADDLLLGDLKPHTNYRPSNEIREAVAAATLGWATEKDTGEQEPEGGVAGSRPSDPSTGSGTEGTGGTSGGNQGGNNNPPLGDLEP